MRVGGIASGGGKTQESVGIDDSEMGVEAEKIQTAVIAFLETNEVCFVLDLTMGSAYFCSFHFLVCLQRLFGHLQAGNAR